MQSNRAGADEGRRRGLQRNDPKAALKNSRNEERGNVIRHGGVNGLDEF